MPGHPQLLVAAQGGPTMMAQIGVMRALNHRASPKQSYSLTIGQYYYPARRRAPVIPNPPADDLHLFQSGAFVRYDVVVSE